MRRGLRRRALALACAASSGVIAGCTNKSRSESPSPTPSFNALSTAEQATGWRLLFDGQSINQWRGFKSRGVPDGWKAVDGTIMRVGQAGDLITIDEFPNFELVLQWKIWPVGNSGIMYRVTEDGDQSYMSGPEMQVLDDARHSDGKSRLTSAGADYGLYPSPAGIVRPAGEWNDVRLVVNGSHVEHWLNGTKVVEYELGSPDWVKRVEASKFKAWPQYGRSPTGHIALQDHGDTVAYRGIKIRELR